MEGMTRVTGTIVRLAMALLLAVGAVSYSPVVAGACACGAVIDRESRAKVNAETAIVHFDGSTETIDMILSLDRSMREAAWLMPTPRDTTLGLGDTKHFEALDRASAPRYDRQGSFVLSLDALTAGAAGGPPASTQAPVQVEKVSDIGPFRVTTLSGSDPEAVTRWLTEQGYPTKPGIIPVLGDYLDDDWVIQAVKLLPATEGRSLPRNLTPLRMSFATTSPVYPIKLSSQATTWQALRLYVISPTPLTIGRQAADDQPLGVEFAGRVPASSVGRSGDDLWLVTYAGSLRPEAITTDYTFTTDPSPQPYQRVIHSGREWGALLVGLSLIVIVAGLFGSLLALAVWGIARVARTPVKL